MSSLVKPDRDFKKNHSGTGTGTTPCRSDSGITGTGTRTGTDTEKIWKEKSFIIADLMGKNLHK
jgi:hypothetical protein